MIYIFIIFRSILSIIWFANILLHMVLTGAEFMFHFIFLTSAEPEIMFFLGSGTWSFSDCCKDTRRRLIHLELPHGSYISLYKRAWLLERLAASFFIDYAILRLAPASS
jgi:hypothetical protein